MDDVRISRAGDGFYAAAHRKAEEQLLEAAEDVLSWLDSRRRHYPPQLRDGREGVHRKALADAIRRVRSSAEERR